ncbi:MAG TPA: hypothetical protein VHA56_17480 [Mucilaginibacter sp.]|nr:hypothetical protein [Mucilaginibacter sp.]
MQNKNAFGKRNLFQIQLRKVIYLIFRSLKVVFKKKASNNGSVIFYKAATQREYADLIYKINWFIPGDNTLNSVILISSDVFDQEEPSSYLSSDFEIMTDIDVRLESETDLNGDLSQSSVIALTRFRYLFKPSILKNLRKVEIIDPYFFSYVESISWQNLYYNSLSEIQKSYYHTISSENFSSLQALLKHRNKGICFVTGPSFDNYKSYDFSGYDLKVICNSIVKNDDFLQYIGRPDILVFADPVFHFGASKYAANFRECVLNVVRKYKCYVFVPIQTLPLMLSLDKSLNKYFIGIDYKNDSYNFPTAENFFVKDNGNILTNLMIPLASSFSDSVYIFGADGREKSEKYFWTHSKSAQFNDLMDSAFETHPSFFRDRDYSDYYDRHCQTVEELFAYGEKRNKTYYSITPSFIPALHSREMKL